MRLIRAGGSECRMQIVKSLRRMQKLAPLLPRPVILVPTMGAIHLGHLALIGCAKKFSGKQGTSVATIFVNPTQFRPGEDYEKYPRPFRRDCRLLQERECDLLFAPTASQMYLPDASVMVTESDLATVMCGASRPGHFMGVCTVVTKLFHLIQPDIVIFGEKDYQQLAILRRMTRDLNFPVRIIGYPTVREPDGLAVSSRNVYLNRDERRQAPLVRQTLLEAASKVRKRAVTRPALEDSIRQGIERGPVAKIDYIAIVDPETLRAKDPSELPVLLAVAVFFGTTRLIDNILVK
jgi:pantoate--beta-alanine ligase